MLATGIDANADVFVRAMIFCMIYELVISYMVRRCV